MPADVSGLPVLSIRDFDGRRSQFSHELGRAWRELGFVGICDHDIGEPLIARAYQVFQAFFALPEAVKQQYYRPGTGSARGYTGIGVEQARDHAVPDLKEFLHVGREMTGDNPLPDILLPNVWPDEVPGFRSVALELYQAMDHLGRRVLAALAVELGLEADWFEDKVDQGNSILRPIHYPPLGNAAPGAVRAARHEDINLITLLVGASDQGLEILTREGQWLPVDALPGTIVVNVGDMLQRLTNHVYRSTTHRVINPSGAAAHQSRYSMPFFVHPNPDFVIRTLPGCVSANNPDRYPESITANDYLLQRLREICLLPG